MRGQLLRDLDVVDGWLLEAGVLRVGLAESGLHAAAQVGGRGTFRLDVGRQNRADPKWILPMLCRRGGITRQDIGQIRIQDTVTEVQIAANKAVDFLVNARKGNADDVFIAAADERPEPRGPHKSHKPRGDGPARPPRDDDYRRGPKGPPRGKAERGGFKHKRKPGKGPPR